MASESVHPLRISKNTPASSPNKMSTPLPRPLSEISPSEKRRNSPSWQPYSPKRAALPGNDSSPFQSSPLDASTSPRIFWQNRNAENMLHGGRAGSPSPTRRSSIERLQKASRVKNSNILALEQKQEYDPTRIPHIERPLSKVQGSASLFSSSSSSGFRTSDSDHRDYDNRSSLSMMSPSKVSPTLPELTHAAAGLPSKGRASPTKSSLSPSKFNKGSFDPAAGTWSAHTSVSEDHFADERYLQRHPKSVTFDAAPPQINEYEMATPDLSSVGTNSREGSYESPEGEEDLYDPAHIDVQDESFDESLEDTVKTPVVGPDDWRGESPTMHPGAAPPKRPDSASSNPDHRPLPPVPELTHARTHSTGSSPSSPGLYATAERMLGGSHRSLPAPPPATATKSDIQGFGSSNMTLEERLKLMMQSDDTSVKAAAEQQRERRLRRGAGRERGGTPHSEAESVDAHEADDTIGDISGLDFDMPPQISRESIMRRVNGNRDNEGGDDYRFSPAGTPSPQRSPGQARGALALDPDVPIPSTEGEIDEAEDSVLIKRSSQESGDDVLDYYSNQDQDDGAAGQDGPEETVATQNATSAQDMGNRPYSSESHRLELDVPQSSLGIADDDPFMATKPSRPAKSDEDAQRPRTPTRRMSKPEYDGTGWGDPDDEEYAQEPDSPGSVIRHPVSDDEEDEEEEAVVEESPAIPERIATIKAPGAKLKTRLSGTPSDLAAMREARRQVSREVPNVPPIPEKHRSRMSRDLAVDSTEEYLARHPSFKNRSLTLDIDMGLSMDQDFERVIEAQKRGYLMRQNTKLISASDKDGAEEGRKPTSTHSSPVKKGRPESWVVEPWNGEMKPQSPRKRTTGSSGSNGSAPPLPGHQSNAVAHASTIDEEMRSEAAVSDSGERGRLFVKVMGVKDLDLPLPKNERTWFSLTLDNGVHCVTTAWLELARNAPIGQEFELVVPNDLEFQLTLNVKLEKPALLHALNAGKSSKSKTSAFSRVFASPRKRKEMEQRQKDEERRQREALARQQNGSPTGYELLSPLTAEDGSFARSYVCLKEHESRCYGRPYMAEVACFNEWATEDETFAHSVKSKRLNPAGVVRRAPYKIGKLELQLLFVPRPGDATDEDMPKSMNSCVRELKAAEERLAQNWEGHLSQQGGDCPYWRRRYFKLVGTKLTAYHEATRQPRATINLSNAKRLIDDRPSLTQKETMGKNGRRRRSAFAEEEEGYMFVEEGFRIRFNNGEVIDFYADAAEDKEGWMRVLSEIIGRDSADDEVPGQRSRAKWCDLVLKREEQQRRRAEGRQTHSRTKSTFS